VQQSIDISCLPGPQQQTRRTLLQRSIAGTDGRTDMNTPVPMGSEDSDSKPTSANKKSREENRKAVAVAYDN